MAGWRGGDRGAAPCRQGAQVPGWLAGRGWRAGGRARRGLGPTPASIAACRPRPAYNRPLTHCCTCCLSCGRSWAPGARGCGTAGRSRGGSSDQPHQLVEQTADRGKAPWRAIQRPPCDAPPALPAPAWGRAPLHILSSPVDCCPKTACTTVLDPASEPSCCGAAVPSLAAAGNTAAAVLLPTNYEPLHCTGGKQAAKSDRHCLTPTSCGCLHKVSRLLTHALGGQLHG